MSDLVLHPSVEEFDRLLESKPLLLVDFWATWCTPCKMIAPVMEQLAERYAGKVAVVKVVRRSDESHGAVVSQGKSGWQAGGHEACRRVRNHD